MSGTKIDATTTTQPPATQPPATQPPACSIGDWSCSELPPPPPDLDCSDVGRKVWVGSYDPHKLDRDNDGWGCESYG